jgi:putative membrane protein
MRGNNRWLATDTTFREDRLLKGMIAGYILFWLWMLIGPYAWFNWWLENLLVFASAAYLCFSFRWFRFNNLSYVMIILFVALHTYGAHYSYNTTPIDELMQDWFGFGRDNFDRIVHFCFGLLIVYPVREFAVRAMGLGKRWAVAAAPTFILAFAALYELIEMWVAAIVAPEIGTRFLGTQGDIWDSHHDIEVALYGAVLTMLVIALISWLRRRRD